MCHALSTEILISAFAIQINRMLNYFNAHYFAQIVDGKVI